MVRLALIFLKCIKSDSLILGNGKNSKIYVLPGIDSSWKQPEFTVKCIVQLRIRRDRLLDESGANIFGKNPETKSAVSVDTELALSNREKKKRKVAMLGPVVEGYVLSGKFIAAACNDKIADISYIIGYNKDDRPR